MAALIKSRIAAALGRCDKLQRRAETAINDGKIEKGLMVLADLRDLGIDEAYKLIELSNSLDVAGYSRGPYHDYIIQFNVFRTWAEEDITKHMGETK